MPAILDLIELGFREELDPQGWKMLDQMRRIYRPNPLANVVYGRVAGTAGYVCEVEGRIIGNLSLRSALPHTSRGRLIGNVVVHPEFRGRGIGHALMERALEAARAMHARWIGLEVRADNVVACRLYEHLGFRVVGITEHLVRPQDLAWPTYSRPNGSWERSRSRHSTQWKQLANLMHSADQRRVLEIRGGMYEFGGFERWVNLTLSGQWERAWLHYRDGEASDLATHIQVDRHYRFHIWDLLTNPEAGQAGAEEIVARTLSTTTRFPAWPVVTLVPPVPSLIAALRNIGFGTHRTLQQMLLEL